MSIQSNINQAISMAGLLYSQSPAATKKREEAAEAVRQEAEKRKAEQAIAGYERMAEQGAIPETEGERAAQLHIAEAGEAAYRRAYELDPTEETYAVYQRAAGDASELRGMTGLPSTREQLNTQRRQEAEASAAAERQAEQERLARSRQFAEMVTAGVTPEYGRREGGR